MSLTEADKTCGQSGCGCEQSIAECCDQPRWGCQTTLREDITLCLQGRGCDAT